MGNWLSLLLLLVGVSSAHASAFDDAPPPPPACTVSGQYQGAGGCSTPALAGAGNVIGSGATVVGHAACWSNTNATGAIDCGFVPIGLGGALGTPSSATLTNATGLPITGLTGLGTGVASALAAATNGTGGFLTYSMIGTSGATLGLLNGNNTYSGNDIFSGLLTFSGLSAGTQVSCLGLSSGNAVVLSAAACGAGGGGSLTVTDGTHTVTGATNLTVTGGTVGGTTPNATLSISGGSTTLTLAPGLTKTPGTQNTGTQTVTNGDTISPQSFVTTKAADYVMSTTATCPDTGGTFEANNSASIKFTLPATGGSCGLAGQSYNMRDISGHGFTVTTPLAVSNFLGTGPSTTTVTVPNYGSLYCESKGGTDYSCSGATFAGSGGPTGSVNQVLLDNGAGGFNDVTSTPTNGLVLTAQGVGTKPVWAAAGTSTSPYTVIAGPVTVTAGASIILDWHLTNTFNVIQIDCYGVFPTTAVDVLYQLGESTGPTWKTSGYVNGIYYVTTGGAINGVAGAQPGALFQYGGNAGSTAATATQASFRLMNAPSSTLVKSANVAIAGFHPATGNYISWAGMGQYTADANPITGFRVTAASGNINGTCTAVGSN